MINLPRLREYVRNQLTEDRNVKSIRARGESIEDALRQASIELGCPVKKIEYEIIEMGSKGTFGLGKKAWIILAYETVPEAKLPGFDEEDLDSLGFDTEIPIEIERRPGEVFVRLTADGVFLKVTRPVGSEVRATERMVLELLSLRGVTDYNRSLVARALKQADGEYIRIGDFDYNPANQSTLSVDISDQEMKAYMIISRPGPGGTDLSPEEIKALLRNNGLTYGLSDEKIQYFIDYPHYNEKILVAEGTEPLNGRDARIIYNFTTDHSQVRLKEKNGRVDFKELNLVENVEAGQLVARKIPPEEGIKGFTVLGKALPAKSGKNVELDIGKNVKLAEDGLTVIATINGQVLLSAGKINVEPIYTVPGDVNFKTGNILFLGTVIVKGNVEDGFTVKAAGNIEIMGSVGKCVLDAEGEVIVHQGILGKNGGHVRAGINVVAKFIEHARVESEENVIVSDGIIHSFVDANKRIICQGKRASIVGGRLRAAEEINAKTLGSVAGTETILETGFDPKRKERILKLMDKKREIEKQLEEKELSIKTLENLKKVQKKLPEEKANFLQELHEQRVQILGELDEINKECAEINEYLASLTTKGKVSASDRVFPGVKIFIKNENLIVRNEFKKITFFLEGKEVRMTKYEPLDEEFIRS